MNPLQTWRLAITPLSPVHLGSGRDYEPSGYVIDGGTLYQFDGIHALRGLPAAERERLAAILDGRPGADMLRHVQGFFYANREYLIPVSRHQVRLPAEVEAFYQERVGLVAQHERGGGKVQNRLEIERTAYNPPTDRAVLPGSGLKGALRTALLQRENDGRPLPPELHRDRKANQRLQQALFDYRAGQFHQDPMRLVQVADAALVDPASYTTEVLFAVNRKKRPVRKDGALVQSQAEQRGLYQLLECLPGMCPRPFGGQLGIQDDAGLGGRQWPRLRFGLEDIAAACNAFYRPILDRELEQLQGRNYLDPAWAEWMRALLAGPLGESLAAGRAFLLRAGRHSGAESVTLEGVRDIKIMQGKGQAPSYGNETKTLWLASPERQAQRNLRPFGWLLIEPYRDAGELPPWPTGAGDPAVVQWRSAVGRRQSQLRERLEQVRRKEDEQRRQRQQAAIEAEQEAERAKREAAYLAGLSPEARALEQLRQRFERDKAAGRKEPGGVLVNDLVTLVNKAEGEWQGEECSQLADLAERIYAFVGWSSGKKRRERKAKIEALRNQQRK